MKFSIIVPVYNVEKYLEKCLESILNQTFKDFEAIIVNDGSTDNSQEIIDKYVNKDQKIFKSFKKENGGLSDARNFGIERAKGEYIVFLDSDDYIDENLLNTLNNYISKNSDLQLLKIPYKRVDENENIIYKEIIDEELNSGENLFIKLRNKKVCIEPACFYCINREYWIRNKFSFPIGKFHEDFAIMLIVLLKAQKVQIIKNSYYNYTIRNNSIMTSNSYEKKVKKAYDKLEHYDNIMIKLDRIEHLNKKTKEICLEYISTAICMSIRNLKDIDKKIYRTELKKRKVLKNFKNKIIRKMFFLIIINF